MRLLPTASLAALACVGIAVAQVVQPPPGRAAGVHVALKWNRVGVPVVEYAECGMTPPRTQTCGDELHIEVLDPLGVRNWTLGISPGLAERCLPGEERDTCHHIRRRAILTSVCDQTELVRGRTTLHKPTEDLTYVLSDGEYCFTWGANPLQYLALGCEPV